MCDNTAPFNLTFNVFRYFQIVQQAYTYSIFDENNNLIYSATGVTGTLQTINEAILGFPLTAGVYTVSGNIAPGSATFSGEFYLGSETVWDSEDIFQYNQTPNSYSLLSQLNVNNQLANARSVNKMSPFSPSTEWIEFTPITNASIQPIDNYIIFGNVLSSNQLPTLTDDFLYFKKINANNVLIAGYINGQFLITNRPANLKVRVVILQNEIKIYFNNLLFGSYVSTPQLRNIRCLSTAENDGYLNVVSSFNCKEPIYSKLDRKVTGAVYQTLSNKLFFIFENEYNNLNSDLMYNVYSELDRVVPVINGIQQSKNLEFGDNRYILDVSSLAQGYYLLEVFNNKGEKFFLKFVK